MFLLKDGTMKDIIKNMGDAGLIELCGVFKEYERAAGCVHALYDVDLAIGEGEFVSVIGQSGSGKSTLMNIIGCLTTPTRGEVSVGGRKMEHMSAKELAQLRNRTIGFIFQSFCLVSRMTALENVELPLMFRGQPPAKRRAAAKNALERVGLGERMSHRPYELSGGQQQRVANARAICAAPPILLADEPTGNLDSASGEAVLALLEELHADGRTIVLITHDDAVSRRAQRRITIADGRITREERLK